MYLHKITCDTLGNHYSKCVCQLKIIIVVAFSCSASASFAESAKATSMWGVSDNSSAGTQSSSSDFHVTSGMAAGQNNAARHRILFSGPNLTVVGSQSIIQVTGDNNVLRDISQTSLNTGNQYLNAPIN